MLKIKTTNPTPETQPAAPLFKAPGIEAKLKEAETKLADSERRYADAALAAELNEPPDVDHSKIVAVHLAEQDNDRRRVKELRVILDGAQKRDEKERRAILAEHNKTIIRVCRSHLAARDAAAEALSAALGEAIKHYKVMVERGTKAKAAVPDWGLSRG